MRNKFVTAVLFVAFMLLPALLPQQVFARNLRLRYENAAYRYKRSSGSDCIGTACMYEAGILKAKKPPEGIVYGGGCNLNPDACSPVTWSNLADAGIYIPGYYVGTVKIENKNTTTGVTTVTYKTTYFAIGIFPAGGSNGGGGGNNPPPIAIGLAKARARELASPPNSCSDVYATSSGNLNASFTISPAGNPSGSQNANGGNYATWGVLPNTETVSGVVPANYVLKLACWQAVNPTGSGTGLSAAVADGQTVTWDLGYTNGTSWPQVVGGDAYAFTDLSPYVPPGTSPRKFALDGATGLPGLVTYGNSADFDADTGSFGYNLVSSKNWLANDSYPRTDYYQIMYKRFGGPTAVNFNNETITQATSSATPYYATGDITTSGNWSVGDGESLIFLIDGNLTIGGKIQTSGTGFVAFIVNGNITVSDSVGTTYNSTTPVVQGVYITSPNGTFSTGMSTVSGAERFVGKGIFVAGDFRNQRDLADVSGTNYNNTYASELYEYDPQILINMPDAMKNDNQVWQEVAP